MSRPPMSRRWRRAGLLAALSAPAALAQPPGPPPDLAEEIRQLRLQIAAQNARIEELRQELQAAALVQRPRALPAPAGTLPASLQATPDDVEPPRLAAIPAVLAPLASASPASRDAVAALHRWEAARPAHLPAAALAARLPAVPLAAAPAALLATTRGTGRGGAALSSPRADPALASPRADAALSSPGIDRTLSSPRADAAPVPRGPRRVAGDADGSGVERPPNGVLPAGAARAAASAIAGADMITYDIPADWAEASATPAKITVTQLSSARGMGAPLLAQASVTTPAPAIVDVATVSLENPAPPQTAGPAAPELAAPSTPPVLVAPVAPVEPMAAAPAAPDPLPPDGGVPQPVGTAPPRDGRPPEVAPLFEQPGVLTPRGRTVLEPSLQYGYSSSNRVALVGYTIIPALLIGLIDVREVKRNTTTAALTLRRGLTNRLEVEARVPYVYRSDQTVSRELFTGTATERAFETSGRHIGDVELAARYQLNIPGPEGPFYVAGLRIKSRTGRDPFEVTTDCQTRCVGENVTGTGLPLELPTGSGFYSIQPNVTALFAADPAVFFGSVSYLHNITRHNVRRLILNGERETLGDVKPGDVLGFNFGIGLALNDKTTFSIGYDHNSVAHTEQNGQTVPGSVRTQLGTLLIGYSYRLSDKKTLNVSVGAGLTRDTPDVTLTVRVPFSF